jgi:predicted SAM-dependent methyltransferase
MAMARSRPAIEDSPPSLDAPFGVLRARLTRGRRRRISTGPRRLHFGCFDRPRDGWLNTDITPHVLISRIPCLPRILHALGRMDDRRLAQHQSGVFRKVERLDVTRRFPFRDGEFEAVYSSHVLEHMPPDEAARCLREVHRVLAPGGIARIAVPDLDLRIRGYDPERADEWFERLLETRKTRSKNRHHWMYNEGSLGRLFREAGFEEVHRCEYREGRCPDVEAMDQRPGSLILEGVR